MNWSQTVYNAHYRPQTLWVSGKAYDVIRDISVKEVGFGEWVELSHKVRRWKRIPSDGIAEQRYGGLRWECVWCICEPRRHRNEHISGIIKNTVGQGEWCLLVG